MNKFQDGYQAALAMIAEFILDPSSFGFDSVEELIAGNMNSDNAELAKALIEGK